VKLAARGLRDLDDGAGARPIADSEELRQVRRQARLVHLKAVISAIVVTGALLLI
jgi:hypothetical protein